MKKRRQKCCRFVLRNYYGNKRIFIAESKIFKLSQSFMSKPKSGVRQGGGGDLKKNQRILFGEGEKDGQFEQRCIEENGGWEWRCFNEPSL